MYIFLNLSALSGHESSVQCVKRERKSRTTSAKWAPGVFILAGGIRDSSIRAAQLHAQFQLDQRQQQQQQQISLAPNKTRWGFYRRVDLSFAGGPTAKRVFPQHRCCLSRSPAAAAGQKRTTPLSMLTIYVTILRFKGKFQERCGQW